MVSDQTGAPTRVEDLALALLSLYKQGTHKQPMHIVHFTNAGQCSWYDFACEIVKTTGSSCSVTPITTADYPTKAVRPAYSVLSLKSLEPYGGLSLVSGLMLLAMSNKLMFEKSILVTGGAGFIGANFVSHFAKSYPHYRIIDLDALTYAAPPCCFRVASSDG